MARNSILLDLNHSLSPREQFLLRQDFEESKIVRNKNGEFATKGGGGGGRLQSGMSDDDLDAAEAEMEREEQEELDKEYSGKKPKIDKKGAKALRFEVDTLNAKTAKPIKDPVANALKTAAVIYLGINAASAVAGLGLLAASKVMEKKAAAKQQEADEKSWHETLGVEKDADWATVRKAYKAKAKAVHPDVSKDPDAAEQMKAVNTAFDNMEKIYEKRGRKDSAIALVLDELRLDFDESKHSRDKAGRFSSKKGQAGSNPLRSGLKAKSEIARTSPDAVASPGGVNKKAAIAVGGAAAATIGAAALASVYVASEARGAAADLKDFDFPGDGPIDFSRYDDLEPGTMIYKGFEVPGVEKGKGMLHYSVYMGKDPDSGEHMTVQCNLDPKNPGTISIIPISIEQQFNALSPEQLRKSSHYKAVPPNEMMKHGTSPRSPEEVIDRANALIGQPYKYGAVKDNCESIARAIVEGESRVTQANKVSQVGRKIAYSVVDAGLSKRREKTPGRQNAKTADEMADLLSKRARGELSASMQAEMGRMRSEWESASIPPPPPTVGDVFRDEVYGKVFQSKGKGNPKRRKDSDDSETEEFIKSLGMKLPDEFGKEVEESASKSGSEATGNAVRQRMWSAYFEVLISTLNVLEKGETGDLRQDEAKAALISQLNLDFDSSKHPRDRTGKFSKKNSISGSPRQSVLSALESEDKDPGGDLNPSRNGRILALAVGVPVAAGVGAIALAGLGVSKLYEEGNKGTSDISKMPFPDPSAEYDFSRYDDLEPGDMIRKAFTVPGQPPDRGFLHYAVYKGKNPETGEHMVIHAVPDPKDPAGTVAIVEQSIEDAVKRGGKQEMHWHSYYQSVPESERTQGDSVPSKTEALERAESLVGQPFDYYSVRSNCESFARLITEGKPYETQGPEASPQGKEFVATMTKRMLDKAREKSPVWQGRTPRDAQQYAEILAKMQANELSDQVKQEMASNRQNWESAPDLPVSQKTSQTLSQIMGWTLNRLDEYEGKNRRRADEEIDDFYTTTGLKTPGQYADLVAKVVAESSPAMRVQTQNYLWSNYLQMTVALIAKDSRADSAAIALVAAELRRDFDPGKHPRGKGGKFAKKAQSAIAGPKPLSPDKQGMIAATVIGVTGTVLLGGVLTAAGAAALYQAHRPGESVRQTATRETNRARDSVVRGANTAREQLGNSARAADKQIADFIDSGKLPSEATDILRDVHGEARIQAAQLISSSKGYKKTSYDKESGLVKLEDEKGSMMFLSRAGNKIISFNATKSPIPFGEIVAEGAPTYNISFQVDESSAASDRNAASSKEIIAKVKDSWNKGIEAMPSDALVETSAYDKDGKGDRRASIYRRMGFQYLPGRDEGVMYAQKKDGVFQKLDGEQLNTFAEELSNFDSELTPRKKHELLTYDAAFSSEHHPRDKNGRFATKDGGRLMRGTSTTASSGAGSVRSGNAGKLVQAGESYTNSFQDDPEFAKSSQRMTESLDEFDRQKVKLDKIQASGAKPGPKDIAEYNAASAEAVDAYHAFHPIATKKMKGLRNELKADSPISRREAEKVVGSKEILTVPVSFGAKLKAKEDLTEFVQISGSNLPTMKAAIVSLDTNGRSYADPWDSKTIVISGSTFDKKTIFHEASHHVECQDPKLVKASAEWVRKRSDGSGQHELSKIADPAYPKGEKAYRDTYTNPYVGKVYQKGKEDIATEVLSVGMQSFDSPENMATLYALDPDHFNYTVGAIRPNGRSRKDSLTVRDVLIDYLQHRVDFDPGLHSRDKKGRFSSRSGDRSMGVWYEGRRTGVMVRAKNKAHAKELADKKKRRGGVAAVVRELTEEEERIAQKGRWVRTGPNGEKPGTLKIRGKGPRPKNYEGKDD